MNSNSFERFKSLAAAYGAEKRHWPETEQPLYDRYAANPEAQLLLAGAQAVDHFLNQWQTDDAHATVPFMLQALPVQQAVRAQSSARAWSLPAAIMMLCALLGFGNGYLSAELSEIPPHDMTHALGMEEE